MRLNLKIIFLLPISTLLVTPSVKAGSYVAISAGSANYETSAFEPPDEGLDESAISYSAGYGFRFNENFSVEAGFIDYGDAEGKIYTQSLGTSFRYYEKAEFSIKSLYAAAIGSLPLSDSVSLQGMIGIDRWDAETSWTAYVEGPNGILSRDLLGKGDGNGSNLYAGLGLLFALSSRIDLSIIYDAHDFDSDFPDSVKINQIKAGINFNI
jgi:OOP family OmpA-OmpF porin